MFGLLRDRDEESEVMESVRTDFVHVPFMFAGTSMAHLTFSGLLLVTGQAIYLKAVRFANLGFPESICMAQNHMGTAVWLGRSPSKACTWACVSGREHSEISAREVKRKGRTLPWLSISLPSGMGANS